MKSTEKIVTEKLVEENQWLPKAIEMLNFRLVDRGFNVLDDWLGFYDEYVLHYIPSEYGNWGTVEIHSKEEVFNPYKYCNGKGFEYEKLGEFTLYKRQWETIEKYIRFDGYQVYGKKVCFDNPYPNPQPNFIDGSDVTGYYYE